jgi:hypothetical protein
MSGARHSQPTVWLVPTPSVKPVPTGTGLGTVWIWRGNPFMDRAFIVADPAPVA